MQGAGDKIVINLLKETITDSSIDTYTYRQIRACSTRKGPKKGKAFGTSTAQTGNVRRCRFVVAVVVVAAVPYASQVPLRPDIGAQQCAPAYHARG